jgi:hypothetical protein
METILTNNFVVPHTEEWFNFVLKQDPMQASHVKRIIEIAGSTEVCSVCGGHSDADYYVKKASIDDKKYSTIRLCDDCAEVLKMEMDEELEKIK